MVSPSALLVPPCPDARAVPPDRSGYGMARNCCGGETLMPDVFRRTLGSVPIADWNFSNWVPDALVINLVHAARCFQLARGKRE
jgi:hypothetical protein